MLQISLKQKVKNEEIMIPSRVSFTKLTRKNSVKRSSLISFWHLFIYFVNLLSHEEEAIKSISSDKLDICFQGCSQSVHNIQLQIFVRVR